MSIFLLNAPFTLFTGGISATCTFYGSKHTPSGSSFRPVQRYLDPLLIPFLPLTYSFNPSCVFQSELCRVVLSRVTDSEDCAGQEDVSDKGSILSKTFSFGHILFRFNVFITSKTLINLFLFSLSKLLQLNHARQGEPSAGFLSAVHVVWGPSCFSGQRVEY